MKRNLYVDNIISGCNSEDQVVEYYKEARTIMGQAKFNLRSWSSNSSHLQSLAKPEGTADKELTVSLLGLLWSTSTDTITFSPKQFLIPTKGHSVTKRIVLQAASRIYDPLGFSYPPSLFEQRFPYRNYGSLGWIGILPSSTITMRHGCR